MVRTSYVLFALCAVLLAALVGAGQVMAGASGTYTFANTTHTAINDLEVSFGYGETVDGVAFVSNGPTTGTQFPTVSGMGTSSVTLSGASVGDPGQSTYTFSSNGSTLTFDSAVWTHDGTELHHPAVIRH